MCVFVKTCVPVLPVSNTHTRRRVVLRCCAFTCDSVYLCSLQHSIAEANVQEEACITTARLISSMTMQHQQALRHSLRAKG